MKWIWALVPLIALAPASLGAATVTAASCAQGPVQGAIDAARAGDIVRIPAGNCTWTATVTVRAGITLQGAGIDATTIRIDHGGAGLRIRTGADPLYRVTGLTLVAARDNRVGNDTTDAMIAIDGLSQLSNWRVDHVSLREDPQSLAPYGIGVSGPTYGVVDHVTFDGIGTGLFVQEGVGADPVLWGDLSWTRPIDWGGPRAVYVEDSTFIGRTPNREQVYDGRYGGRVVFRRNTVRNAWIEPHSGCPNGGRAILHNEVYENTFVDTAGGGMWMSCRIRGGSGVIFNNAITDPDSSAVLLIDNQRSCLTCGGYWANRPCDGSTAGDGNTPGQQGWPCLDQIGRGANQVSEPLYAWGNTRNGSPVGLVVYDLGCSRQAQHLVEGRDYFNNGPRPGYTPYTYPHPLTGGSPGPPPAPTGLRVQ
jgi:hypothetical protein